MRLQVFPVTYIFNQQLWRYGRVATNRGKPRFRAQQTEHASTTVWEPQPGDRLSTRTPQTRADKIAQLRRAVESRTYCVSAEQLAEKMARETVVEVLAEGLCR
jgi:anti-sigma28 factor (negative regulator of flagellin synthesis)